jgi:multisubunit Na+/H+ antiporter MnhE subunit
MLPSGMWFLIESTFRVSQFIASFLIRLVFLRSVLQLLVIVDFVPSLRVLLTLMMKEIHSSETSVLTRATRCRIQEDKNKLGPKENGTIWKKTDPEVRTVAMCPQM